MDRKTFIIKTVGGLILAVSTYALISCSSSSDDSKSQGGNNPDCLANGTSIPLFTNQGHMFTVSKADVSAGVEKTYNIQGSANHSHNVTLTVANFNNLQNNQPITVNSTEGESGQNHQIAILCK